MKIFILLLNLVVVFGGHSGEAWELSHPEDHVIFRRDSIVPKGLRDQVGAYLWKHCALFTSPNEEAQFSIEELNTEYTRQHVDQFWDENYVIHFLISYRFDVQHPGSRVHKKNLVIGADQYGPHTLEEEVDPDSPNFCTR